MDLKSLSQYRALKAELSSIREQIDGLRLTYGMSSVRYDGTGTGNSTPSTSSPTEDVIIKLDTLERKYIKLIRKNLKSLEDIERWLDSLEDPEIKALCRYRYVIGYTWEETAFKVYGRPIEATARKRVVRYFEKRKLLN